MNVHHLRGTIKSIHVHQKALFMLVREERTNGAHFQVKAFCPEDMAPAAWAQRYKQWKAGMEVIVEGTLRFEAEKTLNPGTGQYDNVRHPVTGKDIYQVYIWAYRMDVVQTFSAQNDEQGLPDEHQAPPPARRPVPPAPARAPMQQAPTPAASHDELPAIPWNMQG